MKKNFLAICFLGITGLMSLNAQTKTNPVAEVYPNGYPAWTDNIKWSNVINMKTDGRVTAIHGEWARYEKGVELLGEDGGVLYYPAGTYKFEDLPAGENGAKPDGEGIMLRSGVVIMGEKPATVQKASEVENGDIKLSTIFEFPRYKHELEGADGPMVKELPGHWNFFGLKTRPGQELKEVDNVGICFINVKYGVVYWGAQYTWGDSYQATDLAAYGAAGCDAKNGWMPDRVPDGTHYADPFGGCKRVNVNGVEGAEYLGAGSGRLILNCRFDDGVMMDAGGYKGTFKDGLNGGKSTEFQGLSIEPYRFGARITIDASNVFIAATALTKPTIAFIYKANLQMASKDPIGERDNQSMMLPVPVLFDPAKHIGIDVGKSILGMVSSYQRKMLEDDAPFYETNIVIRDNWVYNHGNKGYEASGRWVKVLNNVNARDFLGGGTIPSKSSPDIINHVGDAKKVYGLTDVIPYKIRSGSGTVDVPGAEGHYIARMSSLRGTNQTDDNMSRAIDLGGHNVWVDGNRYWDTGSWPGNDGEGILGQRSGDVEWFSFAVTNNRAECHNSWSHSGYMSAYDMHHVGGLWYKNDGQQGNWTVGPVGMKGLSYDQVEELAVVCNTRGGSFEGNEKFEIKDHDPNVTKGPLWVSQDFISGAVTTPVLAPTDVKVEYDKTKGYTTISWDPAYEINGSEIIDKSSEVGYRVERRVEGSADWDVVAYRPLQNGYKVLGGVNRTFGGKDQWTLEELDLNAPEWRDYDRVNGRVEYRVVAIAYDEHDNKVQESAPVVVDFGAQGDSGVESVEFVSDLYLNCANGAVNASKIVDVISIINMNGQVVATATNTSMISINDLALGVYVAVAKVDGATATLKVVK